MDMDNIRFAKSARRHRVGRASVIFVIEHNEYTDVTSTSGVPMRWWVGDDERGRELEVGAVEGQRDHCCLVIHVFPTALRAKE